MKKKTLLMAALMGSCSLQGMAQQIIPQDVAGDKEYHRVCREYELKGGDSMELLQAYLDKYPDSRHKNRVLSLMASAYFMEGKYKEAIAMFQSCDLEALPDKERDDCAMRLADAYLKEGDLREAAVWFTLLKEVSPLYREHAIYNLAYIDYAEKRYDKALESFRSLQNDAVYAVLVPYYIGEIHLLQGSYRQAREVAETYLAHYPAEENVPQMERILGEACFGLNDYQAAASSLEKYRGKVSLPGRKALYELGMSYYYTGVYSKAAATLGETTSEHDALSQNAYLHMGLAYLNLKERNQARMSFEQAAGSDWDLKVKEQALYNYALCIHETSYSPFAESVTVFERFLNEFPKSPYTERVNDYLIEVYMNTRSYEAALKSIAKIERPGTRIMEAKQKILFRLGTQAFANAHFQEALDYFNQSLSVGQYSQETKAAAYFWRGESNYRLDRFTQAGNDYRQYLEFATDKNGQEYGLALYNLGYTYFKQKNYANAATWLTRFVDRGNANERAMQADAYNRIGDCNFYNRHFEQARQDYTRAVEIDPSLGDYSLYQEAFVRGLQRDYNGKVQILNRLISDYPESQYMDEALYEQGRAFVQMEDNANAIARFNVLVTRFPESHVARRAANEIGLLYYQDDKYPEAIQAYKQVIAHYPGSEEARLAQRDLKSIYIDLNKVDEYADFASTIPGGANFDVNERDSLTYVAAERVYMRGEVGEARNSFTRYLQTFSEGAFSLNANYYIGLIDYTRQAFESAAAHLDKVLEYPDNKYSEEAMLMSAEMAYTARDYEKALHVYQQLKGKAGSAERRQLALTGILRSAYGLDNGEEIILAATDLLADAKLAPELFNEAHYYRAKAYLAAGKMEAAMADLNVLAKDTRNVYGAEAKYKVAQLYFDGGQTEQAEQEVLNYIEVSTPHTYWLARSFVLLADVYMKLERNLDAKQYLLSLQQNYQADDDIAGMIESRLEKLKNEK
ncbi:tetratricopeptide repeat protein [Phocaeicola sp.]|uniref:tetratricopeptide repeat protein n=1 Tax=Phocaeicola sp. TaxID=2773926 RepID=UPI0023C0C3E2|nr:tetratricopeptide repeat protein [Phocaeicola sp.]MDE5676540.1 tetratricopeptide repeat protein [Phocaeicola sp.]